MDLENSAMFTSKFYVKFLSFAYNSKIFYIWYGGTWEGSLPFYIHGPQGHAPGRG